jgi:hypothetical protein
MRKVFARRPSAAMIVAVLALVMAMVGTGFAAGVFTKAEKKKIRGIATNVATSTFNSQFGGRVMAATVPDYTPACTIRGQTGGITATQSGNFCDITFPKSVANCAVGATPVIPNQDVGGEADLRYLGGATVRVIRTDSAGGTPTPAIFTVFAVCAA